MAKTEFMEIIDLIFKLINKSIPGNEEALNEIQRKVFGYIEKDYKEISIPYAIEKFYTETIKLFAGLMKTDKAGKVAHEVKIDTDELFQSLQAVFEEVKQDI